MTQLPANVPGFINAAAPFVNQYGYFGMAGLLLLESAGVPVPGETTIIVAALFAGLGHLNILLVVLVAFLAAVIGDNIAFAVGDFGGRKLLEKYGKYILVTNKKLNQLENFFNKHGGKIILAARFIEGLRQLNGFIAGISEMKWKRFIQFNAIGAFVWVLVWSGVGYYGSNYIKQFFTYGLYISAVGLLVAIGFIVKQFVEVLREKKT